MSKAKNITTVISKVDKTGLKVRMNNDITIVYLYTDQGGEYFLNENLVKQYVKDTPTEEIEKVEVNAPVRKKKRNWKENLNPFEYHVEYEHGDDCRRKFTTIWAKDQGSAEQILLKRFKNIYEYAECQKQGPAGRETFLKNKSLLQ